MYAKRSILAAACLTLAGIVTGAQAAGTVRVEYKDPDNFRDLRDEFSARPTQKQMDRLTKAITEATTPYLKDGQTLQLTVLDVDLAGEMRPVGAQMREMRIMTRVTWPHLKFRYNLSGGNQPERSGEVILADMDYDRTPRMGKSSEPLYFEKRMIEKWAQKALSDGADEELKP